MIYRVVITALLVTVSELCTAQSVFVPDSMPAIRILDLNPRLYKTRDSNWFVSGICKPLRIIPAHSNSSMKLKNTYSKQPSLLQLRGNVQYDFLYRSLVDTPYYQANYRQHTLQANLDMLIKNTWPVRVTFLARSTNSPYFRNIADVNIQFSQAAYVRQLKDQLLKEVAERKKVEFAPLLSVAEQRYLTKLDEVQALQNWLESPARVQELVEEKERSLLLQKKVENAGAGNSLMKIDSNDINGIPVNLLNREAYKKLMIDRYTHYRQVVADSVLQKIDQYLSRKEKAVKDSVTAGKGIKLYSEKKEAFEKAKKELREYEQQANSIKKRLKDSVSRLTQEVQSLKDIASVEKFIKKNDFKNAKLPKGWSSLSAVKSFGVGRSWVDYSELTVKNITLTGVNIEVNPSSFYLAVAAGRVNYRFRDFIIENREVPKQSLFVARAGVGNKDGNNFIVTYYDGKRSVLNNTGNQFRINNLLERVVGVSAETRINVSEHHYIIAEVAKSSFGGALVSPITQSPLQKVGNFKIRSNEAYSIRLNSSWPAMRTKLTGFYRKTGERFQSFNLLPLNIAQEAFAVKLQQQLWKKRITTEAGIRKNDFSNPLLNPGVSSNMIFKSVQINLRVPKYPFVSIGYFPSSQLTVLDNNLVVENQYNTLNALVSYTYSVKKTSLSSNVVYLKFYNNSSDTGFIYYNASSFSFNQFVFLGGLQFQSGITFTSQKDLNITTLEQSITGNIKNSVSLTGGLKYNRVNREVTNWGIVAGLGWVIPKIGQAQLNYDKSYLPGTNRNLLPVETGRLSFIRDF